VTRLAFFSFVLLVRALAAPPEAAASAPEYLKQLSVITGLAVKRQVVIEQMSREELKSWIEEQIKEQVKPEEIRTEQLALQELGFLPAGYDLKQATIDLLSEQAAAFYDYRRRKLFLLEGANAAMQEVTLMHELAHALADQHVALRKLIESTHSDDAQMARLTAVEGQATWLMYESMLRRAGSSLKESTEMLEKIGEGTSTAAGMFPVFDKAPLYMRETLLFPYTQGVLFQQAVFQKLGKSAFLAVLSRPPVSTRQVLHPAAYFANEAPRAAELPAALKGGYKEIIAGTLGELDYRILLEQYGTAEAARKLAPQWRGARFRLYEAQAGGRLVLQWAAEWATPAAAREFFDRYKAVLEGKRKRVRFAAAPANRLRGEAEGGFFEIVWAGTRVQASEGLPDAVQ
jgi:hypothetical protein